jgi:hypothetical protein
MADDWVLQLRVRAWYAIFAVAGAAANEASLEELRVMLIAALEAVEQAQAEGQQ